MFFFSWSQKSRTASNIIDLSLVVIVKCFAICDVLIPKYVQNIFQHSFSNFHWINLRKKKFVFGLIFFLVEGRWYKFHSITKYIKGSYLLFKKNHYATSTTMNRTVAFLSLLVVASVFAQQNGDSSDVGRPKRQLIDAIYHALGGTHHGNIT